MAKSWKCARCGAANPESVLSCQGCGMIRGAVVPTVPQPPAPSIPPGPSSPVAWTAPPAGAGPPSGAVPGWSISSETEAGTRAPTSRRRSLMVTALLFGGFVVFGGFMSWYNSAGRSATGEINKSGDMRATDLRVGDCFDLEDPAASLVDKLAAKPCDDAHTYEAFYIGELPAGDYPTDAAFESYVAEHCDEAFATYVGTSYGTSTLEVFWFYPAKEGWAEGDRTIQCAVYDPAQAGLTESVKGSAR